MEPLAVLTRTPASGWARRSKRNKSGDLAARWTKFDPRHLDRRLRRLGYSQSAARLPIARQLWHRPHMANSTVLFAII